MYRKEFIDLVLDAVKTNTYIGSGNPNAKILIVGKECAIASENIEQQAGEITDNARQWQHIIDNGENYDNGAEHNPRIYGRKIKENAGHTWSKYAKLHDMLFDNDNDNFYNHFFITEMSVVVAKYSKDANKTDRKRSIEQRRKLFKNADFFQQFPIVIMANGNYAGTSIEDTFGVKWLGKDKGMHKLSKGNWYSIHKSLDSKKIVIHTRQLSLGVTNELLDAIAEKIKSSGISYQI